MLTGRPGSRFAAATALTSRLPQCLAARRPIPRYSDRRDRVRWLTRTPVVRIPRRSGFKRGSEPGRNSRGSSPLPQSRGWRLARDELSRRCCGPSPYRQSDNDQVDRAALARLRSTQQVSAPAPERRSLDASGPAHLQSPMSSGTRARVGGSASIRRLGAVSGSCFRTSPWSSATPDTARAGSGVPSSAAICCSATQRETGPANSA